MSQDIAAVILVIAAAVVPIAVTALGRRRRRKRRYPGTVKLAPGIRIRADDVPRHFAAGRRASHARPDSWWLPALGNFASHDEPSRSH